ncbi:Thioredoxin-like protein [Anatilimnocola aggregata]|uniref:Thioredoxin-like protein n=1 Tax=Anatilimnocola aggregata TaxID=2528021 RepID=A0A517Y9W2_9BACT|nr:trypsin-like peptidase domain-containing protein [Anatilimnocola aggregata]QDU27025.1 Thioredoxin-like protein [Anatilimnocola aggregata]
MTTLSSLVLLAVCAVGGDPVLVQFHSTNCGPCRAMHPVVQRLAGEGYPLQQVDTDQQPQLAQQFKVRSLPTFILFNQGREVDRVEGPATFDQLSQLVTRTGFKPNAAVQQVAYQQPLQQPGHQPATSAQETQFVSMPGAPEAANMMSPNGPTISPEQRAAWATVRLKVEDAGGYGFGTGTIIDRHDDEALVMTCGHIFRQSQGKGKISVDLFAPGAGKSIEGQLIGYDLDRDVALVSVRPGIKIDPVPVAPGDYVVAPRDRIFTIGCDKGADPSLVPSHVLQINRYQGAPNITVAGMPVGGRSGGGLFAENGMLIGVCNAADEKGNEGLYAALASVHWQLDQIGQSAIYKRTPAMQMNIAGTTAPAPIMPASFQSAQPLANQPAPMAAPPVAAAPALLPATMPTQFSQQSTPAMAPAGLPADDTEVIVIVRSRSNPARQSEIFVMDRPAAEILQQLQTAGRPAQRGTSQDMLRSAPRLGQTGDYGRTDGSPIVRGQSQ